MKLTFNIEYRTHWGESLYLVGSLPQMGAMDASKGLLMDMNSGWNWTLDLNLPKDTVPFEYRFVVKADDGTVKNEWGHARKFTPGIDVDNVVIYDRWQDQPHDKPFYSSAFTECITRHSYKALPRTVAKGEVTICVQAPMLLPGQTLAISGSVTALGDWNPRRSVRMDCSDFPIWKVNIPAADITPDTEYKFLVLDTETSEVIAWEGGANRRIDVNTSDKGATVIAGMRFINTLPKWKGAGTAIPVFSLRSNDDFGVGDFYDIFKLVDWAVSTGQSLIQLLPVNDTTMTHTWTDSYPYNANSTFALHPMYLRVEELGKLKSAPRRKHYEALRKQLNALETVDYEKANNAKNEYIAEIFAQEGKATLDSDEFKAFMAKNESWLLPYAAFCALRDHYGTPDFSKWSSEAVYSGEVLKRVVAEHKDAVDLSCYVQYHLDKQMRAVHAYANAHGVALKGDIPIGISRTSVDAWVNPSLFYMDCQAGAPPDDFSVLGQNWGFPTYNWEVMNRDEFAWWKARFSKMAEYFDAYRIDHVLGFFRIWQIPMDALHGLLGVFNPALPYTPDELRYNYDFWIDPATQVKPCIMDWFLGEFFGEYTAEVKEKYLVSSGNGRYNLRPEVDTQRKIADLFASMPKNDKNSRICDGLIGLVDQVLFIEDPEQPGKYHPRISAQYSYSYRCLSDYERWCFDRLYNDFFYRRHNDYWYSKAMWKLPPLIESTSMLCCAEDLGMIPACVPAVMEQLQILSLEIQRMPKDPKTAFGDPAHYPYNSVCTTSTHDMSGLRGWWEEDRAKSQEFFNVVLHEAGACPYYAEPWVCERVVDQHLKSPSMLCVLPLQDWLSIDGKLRRENPEDERINVPANSRHYWRYRMHLTLEELAQAADFNARIKKLIADSGRK